MSGTPGLLFRRNSTDGAVEALPGLFVNGDLTMGENIADLGGLLVALDAYRLSLGGREAPVTPRSLYVDREQRLWVGSFGAGARYATIEDRPMAQWAWQRWLGQVGSRDRQVWTFAETGDGDLFIGSDVGVTRWRNQGRDVVHLDLEPEQMDELRRLLAASDGAIWASTVGGVHRIDPQTLATRRFARDDGLNDLIDRFAVVTPLVMLATSRLIARCYWE